MLAVLLSSLCSQQGHICAQATTAQSLSLRAHDQMAPFSKACSPYHPGSLLRGSSVHACSLFLFHSTSQQNCVAANPASVPKAAPQGPSCPAEVMAVILLMGSKMNGTLCPECMRHDGMGGWGRRVWLELTLLWGLIRS